MLASDETKYPVAVEYLITGLSSQVRSKLAKALQRWRLHWPSLREKHQIQIAMNCNCHFIFNVFEQLYDVETVARARNSLS